MLLSTTSISWLLLIASDALGLFQSVQAGTLTTGRLYENNVRSRRGIARRAQPSALPGVVLASIPDNAVYIRCPDTLEGVPLSARSISRDTNAISPRLNCRYRQADFTDSKCFYSVIDGTVQSILGADAACPASIEPAPLSNSLCYTSCTARDPIFTSVSFYGLGPVLQETSCEFVFGPAAEDKVACLFDSLNGSVLPESDPLCTPDLVQVRQGGCYGVSDQNFDI